MNPFLYRGYYYDHDLELYYLNSRYYDPQVGRFINADDPWLIDGANAHLLENNLFAYCFNNPVTMSDDTGAWPKWLKKAVAAVAVVAVVAAVTVATAGTGTAIAAVAVGAAKGAAIGMVTGAASGAAIGYATTGTLEGTLDGMADGALSGAITGTITGGVKGYCSSVKSGAPKASPNAGNNGKPFNPNGGKCQVGVDPKTITPSKDLSTLDPYRLKQVEKYGMDKAISVYRNGIVEDGNHRLAIALRDKIMVDVNILY